MWMFKSFNDDKFIQDKKKILRKKKEDARLALLEEGVDTRLAATGNMLEEEEDDVLF